MGSESNGGYGASYGLSRIVERGGQGGPLERAPGEGVRSHPNTAFGRDLAMPRRPLISWFTWMLLIALPMAAMSTFSVMQGQRWGLSVAASVSLAVLTSSGVGCILLHRVLQRPRRSLAALEDAVRSFRDRDYSVRLASDRDDEIGQLQAIYNQVADTLHGERSMLFQREVMLDLVLQTSPMAVILTNSRRRIVFTNRATRDLFATRGRPEGHDFGEILADCPEDLRRALESDQDALFTMQVGGEEETYHVARRLLTLNAQPHTLYLVEHLTPELRRREVAVWKKAIRLMSHEINNSLAPITSLTRSARELLDRPQRRDQLASALGVIGERAEHLRDFLEGYARFARLPKPRCEAVPWEPFLSELMALYPHRLEGELPTEDGFFDASQMEQVLINLLKNAQESGSDPSHIRLRIEHAPAAGSRITVSDRGRGLGEEEIREALLPFYSTKAGSSGLGLPLCREILEAHGGSLRLIPRQGGGLVVDCWLPPRL